MPMIKHPAVMRKTRQTPDLGTYLRLDFIVYAVRKALRGHPYEIY